MLRESDAMQLPHAVDGAHRRTDKGQVNQIRESLRAGEFLYTLEYVPDLRSTGSRAHMELRRNAELVGRDPRIAGVNIADRVKGLDSLSTVECGELVIQCSGKVPLLHLAGKDRDPRQAHAVFERALSCGLENMLLITGDGITEPRADRIRYHESVVAIHDVKDMEPGALVAAAVSPFKYREEELANQYLKMIKKVRAGADYLITNCGWDMRKFAELAWYRDARGLKAPVVANLLLPTMGWARGIHSHRLPGVFMSDDLFQKICEEHESGKEHARRMAWRRLALQIVGVQRMGYAGVHLSGVETYEDLCAAIELAHELGRGLSSLEDWQEAWDDAHRLASGRVGGFAPKGALYLFQRKPAPGSLDAFPSGGSAEPTNLESNNYTRMRGLHHLAFEPGTVGTALMGGLVRTLGRSRSGERALLALEHATKHAALGCESCGFCRIEYLFYICPETCPKGLANGPCAGTDDNICEFKDRECIHNRKYRVAKQLGRLDELEGCLVPAVSGTRGTSSWINYFERRTPGVIWLTPIR